MVKHDMEVIMGVTTDVFTTVYIVWIAASVSALAWAYRHTVKEKLCGSKKRA